MQTEFFLSIFEISVQRSRFQHWLYGRPAGEFTLQDADAYCLDTVDTYGVSWEGYWDMLKRQWSYPSKLLDPLHRRELLRFPRRALHDVGKV